jgi:hypothetical protein
MGKTSWKAGLHRARPSYPHPHATRALRAGPHEIARETPASSSTQTLTPPSPAAGESAGETRPGGGGLKAILCMTRARPTAAARDRRNVTTPST